MHRLLLTAITIIILSSITFAQTKEEVSKLFDKLLHVSKGDTLPYRLLKPVNPTAMETFPLVIFLHGAGERGNDNEVQIKHITDLFLEERNRGKYPCYIIAPQCPKKKFWSEYNTKSDEQTLSETPTVQMKLVIELIEKISKEFPIDKSRIYITGLSMGGYGTWDLIARYPNKFAAAVPICGGGDAKTASVIKHIPIWAFHGSRDKIVPPVQSRKMIAALQDAGGLPGYTEYPDVEHNSWIHAYNEPHLIHWLFKQTLPKIASNK
jgi:predicted peptidase